MANKDERTAQVNGTNVQESIDRLVGNALMALDEYMTLSQE